MCVMGLIHRFPWRPQSWSQIGKLSDQNDFHYSPLQFNHRKVYFGCLGLRYNGSSHKIISFSCSLSYSLNLFWCFTLRCTIVPNQAYILYFPYQFMRLEVFCLWSLWFNFIICSKFNTIFTFLIVYVNFWL